MPTEPTASRRTVRAAAVAARPPHTVTHPTPAPARTVHARLLGPFEVRLPSGRVAGPWTRPTARRLLQLLLLSRGHRIGREEVIDLLFPELSPERAANAVSKALSMARRALADGGVESRDDADAGAATRYELIRADRSTIWIDPDIDLRVDLQAHEQALRAALDLSPGHERDHALTQALQHDGRLLDGELYADWAIERRDLLDQLRRDARLALARDRSTGHGRTDLAIDAWNALFATDPTTEEAAIALMQSYVRQGRRDEAVRTFHRCSAALRRLLDADPSPALEMAFDQAQQTSVIVQPLPALPGIATFGRDDVLDQIYSQLDRTLGGLGPTIAIFGPAGIGKSHMLATVRSRLIEQGWLVLHATSIPADAVVPYAAIRTALAPLANDVRHDTLLARVLGREPGPKGAGAADATEQQMILTAEIADLLDHAASPSRSAETTPATPAAAMPPVALVLDDAHWMEPSLAALVSRLASRPAPRRWTLVIAARTDEPGAPVPPLASSAVRIDLAPLPPETLAQVIRDRLGPRADLPPDEMDRVVRRSAGNPLFAVELARASLVTTTPTVPESISELFEGRLAAATRAGRPLVPAVALAGDAASFELVLHVGERILGSETATIEAIDDLLAHGLLAEDTAGVRLIHPLLRDTALASLNPVRAAALHEALADSIERIGGDDAGLRAARHRIAAFTAAGLRKHAEAAVREGSAAADAAFDVFAEGPALELYRGVLAAFNTLPAAHRAPWRARAVTAWLHVGRILTHGYQDVEAQRALQEALALAETDEERSSAWRALATIPYRKGDFRAAVAVLEEGLASLSGASDLIGAEIRVGIAWSKMRDGRTDEAVDSLRAALPVLEDTGTAGDVFYCLDYLALALEASEKHDEAADAWSRAEATLQRAAEQVPKVPGRWFLYARAVFALHRGLRPLLMGDAAAAVRDLEAAVHAFLPVTDRHGMAVAHGLLASAYQLNGDLTAALERWETVVECAQGHEGYLLAGAHASRAAVLDALGRADDAGGAADLARSVARDDPSPSTIDEVEEIVSGRTIFLSLNRRGLTPR